MIRTLGSLCSGIGGLDLGLERALGAQTLFQVEINPYARSVLRRHWPDAIQHADLHEVGVWNLPRVDCISAGFPCQPHSLAGKRGGRSDDRWIFPEVMRIVRELQPRYVVWENVPGLLTSDEGGAFDEVLRTMDADGFDALWGVLGADDVGAPHRRKRVFVVGWRRASERASERLGHACGGDAERRRGPGDVAHATGRAEDQGDQRQRGRDAAGDSGEDLDIGLVADTGRGDGERRRGAGDVLRASADADRQGHLSRDGLLAADRGEVAVSAARNGAQPDLGRDAYELSAGLDRADARLPARWPSRPGEAQHAWEPPRLIPKQTRESPRAWLRKLQLTALGNAVVPAQAEAIGLILRELDARLEIESTA